MNETHENRVLNHATSNGHFERVLSQLYLKEFSDSLPQGGIISPTLANATLDGMEKLLEERYAPTYVDGKLYYPKVHLVRYADDFCITADKQEALEEIKVLLTDFLAERGLTLSQEKTIITHVDTGFDFLGFNIRRYNGTLLIKPSKKSQKRFTEKLHEVVFSRKAVSQQRLIEALNPVLTGWGNYYRYVVSKEVFSKMDHILNRVPICNFINSK